MKSLLHSVVVCSLLVLASFTSGYAQVSVTATAGTTGPTSYSTVNAALAAITAGTHQGQITIAITGNTTEPIFSATNQLVASGSGSANYQSVRIVPIGNVVVSSAATPTANRGMLEFIGADSITIDGDDPLTPGTRNLTFQVATTTSTYTSALRFSSSSTSAGTGCRNVTVRNCIIIGSRISATATNINFGITASVSGNGTHTSLTSSAQDNDNMVIENNDFKRCYYGFHAYGGTTNVMDSLVIRNNKFGNDTSAINIGLNGIYMGYTALAQNSGSAVIEGNDIQAGDYGTTGYSASIAGIQLVAGNAGAIIRRNDIHDISQPSPSGWGAAGININSATNNTDIRIHNNFIRGIVMYPYQNSTFSVFQPIGIFANASVSALRINHNTILIPNQLIFNSTFSAHGILLGSGTSLAELNNNIIINQYPTSAAYAVTSNAALNFATASVNGNNYLTAGTNIGFAGGIGQSNMTAWRTATTKDSNSVSVLPPFISTSNLRLQTGAKTRLESGGVSTGITTDVDGQVRPGPAGSVNGGALAPDIGADEADCRIDSISFDSSTVLQFTGPVAPNSVNNRVLRIAVHVSGSLGSAQTITQLFLNTAGTTSASDISNAKLFFTGSSSTFSMATQYGSTVTSPSGAFSFSGSQVLASGINYFWLTYDIASAAVINNLADARLDSTTISGSNRVPVNGNPSGALTILPPMTFVSSTPTHPNLSKVELGSDNNIMMRIPVRMSAIGSGVLATQFNLSTAGSSNPLTNIDSIIVWYTGTNPNFAFPAFFGSTGSTSGSFSITGSQALSNDTNYFWVTYKIKITGSITDSVDVELTNMVINGITETPTISAPAGARLIRLPYCATGATSAADGEIWNVTVGGLSFTSSCLTTGGTNSVLNMYSNYTTLINPVSIAKGSPIPFSIHTSTCGGGYPGVLGIWMDLNDDGDFTDAGEELHMSPVFTYGSGVFRTGFLSIPCSTVNGIKRLRVTLIETGTSPIAPCGTYGYGETEDYLVNIIDQTPQFLSTTAIQQTGTTSPGSTDVPILRIPVRVAQNACSPLTINEFRFNTAGSTNVGDIVSAKLYKTGPSAIFAPSTLVGTVSAPSGVFTFTIADTAINDTNNYWLAYDISGTALNSNLLDARLDSILAFGGWRIPNVSAPAGNVVVTSPITFVSATVSHPTLDKVERGENNARIARVLIRMSSLGASVPLTQFNLSTNGSSNPLSNIDSVFVWYTGTNPNFTSPTLFANSGSQSGAFTLSGLQNLNTDTNYFWIAYDIRDTALVGDSVDIEVPSFTINSAVQTPSIIAPAGSRIIRSPYCPSVAGTGFDGEIWNVTVGTLNNSSTCFTTGGVGSTINAYSNYTNTVSAPNLIAGGSVPFSVHTSSCGGSYDGVLGIWIDFNDDGDFTDVGEQVHMSPVFTYGTTVFRTGTLTIPCTSPGLRRMRVILEETGTSPISPCASYFYGETEDYMVNILSAPASYTASTTIQQTGVTSAGAVNVPILRVPITTFATSCLPDVITQLNFNTSGTTSVGNILSAKLYKTGNSAVFSTANLVGTVSSPSGAFAFVLSDTAVNDTNNYWLTYDISGTAPNSNVLDARFDSALVFGSWRIPTVSNPSGNIVITTPMTYVSSTATHPTLSKIERGTNNNQILRMRVIMSSSGAAVQATQFELSVNGSASPLTNIDSISVWFTGANPNFTAPVFFGSSGPQSGSYTINGSQNVLNDTNYFWLTYRVPNTAIVGDSVDAEVTSITIAGTPQVPTVTAPIGSRGIKNAYCVPTIFNSCTSDDLINNVSTTGGSTNISNLNSGCNGNPNNYIFYNSQVVTVRQGATFTLEYQSGTTWAQGFSIYVDYNDDGDFTDAGELVAQAAPSTLLNSSEITIPLNATLGNLRMRVFCEYFATPASPCASISYGETEDYIVNVLPGLAPVTYVWNQTIPGNFTNASNWTPSRTTRNLSDILVFGSGSTAVVNDVTSQTVATIRVLNNTNVQFNATSAVSLGAWDSLNVVSGKIATNTNTAIRSGSRGVFINGVLELGKISTMPIINGTLERWINTTTSTYEFPVRVNDTIRTATITYTTAPTTDGSIAVRFVNGLPGNGGLPIIDTGISLNRAAINGVWDVQSRNNLSGGIYTISLTGEQFTGINNLSTISVIYRTNSGSSWTTSGVYTPTSGTVTSPVFNRAGLNVFGQFTAASDTLSNPLPVNLLELTASPLNKDVMVAWVTASEMNNKGFYVQRSSDGILFEDIAFVAGNKTTTVRHSYSMLDARAFDISTVLYYRLRQVDLDGAETLSNMVSVSYSENQLNQISVAPNPFHTSTSISFSNAEEGPITIQITDLQGKVLSTRNVTTTRGVNEIPLTELETLSGGVYFVTLIGKEVAVRKVVKSGR